MKTKTRYRVEWIEVFDECGSHKYGDKIFIEKSKILFNQYGITLVNPARCPNVKSNIAKKFIKWLTSFEGQNKIKAFKVKGKQMFFPNAN